jgi:hypothetical protein
LGIGLQNLRCTSAFDFVDKKGITSQDMTLGSFHWHHPGGKLNEDPYINIGSSSILENMNEAFATKSSDQLTKEIRALVAIIKRTILASSEDLIQLSANKFFVNSGY